MIRVQRELTAPYKQTVVVSVPASLLSADQVLITEENGGYTARVTHEAPVRVVYEVGLLSDINPQNVAEKVSAEYKGVVPADSECSVNYDPATDTVTWCDSNMKGEKRNGERYGYVQYDAVKEIDWFVDAFCRKKYGATIYRLRDDIIFAEE